jgi:hypothetical protein
MKTLIRIAAPVMLAALLSGAPLVAQTQNSAVAGAQTQDWNTPPPGTAQAQQAYHDGIEAAQLDRAAKRKIDAKVSHLYVHPPVKGEARDEYRASFAAGYDAAVKHNTSDGL